MNEFDVLLEKLKDTVKENLYVEDEKVYLKCKLKYDVYNLVYQLDKKFITDLENELKVIEEEK